MKASVLAFGLMLFGVAATAAGRERVEYAFGRPVTGPRRKRLSPMLPGRNLWSAEEMERELEAASFGDLFFERILGEGSYSYSYSYSYDYSESMSYSLKPFTPPEADTPAEPPASAPVPETSDDTTSAPAPVIDDAPEPALNRFSCDAGGEISLEEDTSPEDGALPVQISYSYSYEATTDDPNTVYLIEAAIVETIISAVLDCESDTGDARSLQSAPSVSTTFSSISGTDPCNPTELDSSYCYIIDSSIDLQLTGATSVDQARTDALTNVQKAMDNGKYASGYIPNVTKVSYLGPDLGTNEVTPPQPPDSSTEAGEPSASQQALSAMTKSGIALMSIGGVVLAVAIMRRRSHRNHRNRQHVALKDEDLSIITGENSDGAPSGSPTNQASGPLSVSDSSHEVEGTFVGNNMA